MAKRIAIPFALVLIAGLALGIVPYLTQKREVTALTPAVAPLPPASLVPAGVKPGSSLCIHDLPLSPDGQVARVMTATGGKPGPALLVTAQGPGYDARTTVRAGWKEGNLEVPLKPPARSERGLLCFKNVGSSGFALMASGVGEKLARPTPYLDAQPLQQDVPLVFHKARPASMLSRAGALVDHAAVFSPLPVWLLWLLVALVLVGLPLAVAGALVVAARSAPAPLQATDAPPLPGSARIPRAARLRPVLTRSRALARRIPAWVVVAAIVLVALAFLYVWAARTTTFQPDEAQNVYFGRWVAGHLPGSLWNFTLLERGLQRLEIWLLALGLGVLRSPGSFLFVHVVNVAAYASAAVPAYLIARRTGARLAFALAAAVLVVALPWAVVTTSFLTESLAYPAFVWTLWATWRALVRPTIASELLAFAILAVALLTRSAFLALTPLLPITVILQELRFGSRRPVPLAKRIVKRHPVVAAAIALAVLGLLASAAGILPPPSRLTGSYGTPFSLTWGPFLGKVGFWFSRVVVGTGFVTFAIGLPWLVRELVRPQGERSHAYALVAVVGALLLLYASNPAGLDERYVMYFAPILSIAAVLALDRARMAWPWIVAGGGLAAYLISHYGWNPAGGAEEFFLAPAESFYARVGLLRLGQYTPTWLPVSTAALLIALALTALVAVAIRARKGATFAALIVALLVGFQLVETQYALSKYVDGAGGRYQATLDQRAWVDQALSGKKGDAAFLASGRGDSGDYNYIWSLLEFWNSRVTGQYGFGVMNVATTPGDYVGAIEADRTTGRAKATPPFPPYMVLPRDFVQVEPAGKPIVRPLFNGLDLWRVDKPDRIAFRVDGTQEDGVLTQGAPARIRFYAAAQPPGARCAEIPITAAAAAAGPSPAIPYRIGPRRGVIPPATQINVQIPLRFGGRPYLDFPVSVRGKVLSGDGRTYAARLLIITTGSCTAG